MYAGTIVKTHVVLQNYYNVLKPIGVLAGVWGLRFPSFPNTSHDQMKKSFILKSVSHELVLVNKRIVLDLKLKMKQRCPLAIRFGKDIASLIHLRVWQSKMNDVVINFKTYVNDHPDSRLFFVAVRKQINEQKTLAMPFNYRIDGFSSVFIRGFANPKAVLLPKNYWTIKELY